MLEQRQQTRKSHDKKNSMTHYFAAETETADTVDGSSLASWDTAEQSVVTWSEVMMEPTMVGSPCLERLPLALPHSQTQGIQLLLPTTPTNNPPLCAFPPLDQLNKKVCPTNIVHTCRDSTL